MKIIILKFSQGINKDNQNTQNTVKLYEYFDMGNEFAIIMELWDFDLAYILYNKKEKKVSKSMKYWKF